MNEVTNTASEALDVEIASLDQLEGISLQDLLGGDVSDYNISQNLPDCMVGVVIEEIKLKPMAAIPEDNKKARLDLALKMKVCHVFSCDDRDVDPQTLIGRYHFENLPMLMDFGKARAIMLILGVVGVKFSDKRAWAELSGSFDEVLAQLVENSIQFGLTIKTTSKNGYDNTRFVDKQAAFISMNDYQERVG